MAATSPQQQHPELNPYANGNGIGTTMSPKSKKKGKADIQSTMASIKNSETVQSLANGPVADKARKEADATSAELSNLAAARNTTPASTTATGQNLTHYHSFFYTLLSWENPRITALSYVAVVLAIFAVRYLPIVPYLLKASCITLGIMAAAESAGKLFMNDGFASKLRPNKYYTLPRATLESIMEDLVELANFFIIEFQRIVFAENVVVTIAAFATLLTAHFLIKVTPAWGLALMFTTTTYFLPLIYKSNKQLIDSNLSSASDALAAQTQQVRDLASQHAGKAVEMGQSTLRDYSARASDMVGTAKKSAVDKGIVSPETAEKLPGSTGTATSAEKKDFPVAPKTEPLAAPASPGSPIAA